MMIILSISYITLDDLPQQASGVASYLHLVPLIDHKVEMVHYVENAIAVLKGEHESLSEAKVDADTMVYCDELEAFNNQFDSRLLRLYSDSCTNASKDEFLAKK